MTLLEGSELFTHCPVCNDVNPIVTTLVERGGTIRAVDMPCGFCGRRNGEPPATPFTMDYYDDNTMRRRERTP